MKGGMGRKGRKDGKRKEERKGLEGREVKDGTATQKR